ncbi:hypothetical protein SO802_026093 [Lithocarpus litseifolius]|uniref:Reverse transcriptase domain-containing protein n=1 Tax=Lithocarpus litseifolius TaxID=425828 RepID=A0AAW2C074_9ROSI
MHRSQYVTNSNSPTSSSPFEALYTTGLEKAPIFSPISHFSCCYFTEEDQDWIGRGVTEEDVRNGLWALKPFKAPGPDGLHAGFFQRFWPEVGRSVCSVVISAFNCGVIPEYLNETLITLIPKCQYPESLNNYRPISLCNTVYKIVSKIIVRRIRPLISKLVSPLQAAFVPGRKSIDNVVIAQELFYALDRKKGKEGYMAIKVDLEKAYDRLEWSFIHKVLQAFRFPQNIIRVIMSCITSPKVSILYNGGTLESFAPSRGIRQGDPLFPYLFILCMEYLGHLIEQKCVEGMWKPLKASRDNVGISHLFFADDLLLFAKVDSEACEAVPQVLCNFCNESGQKISLEKSRIYFSPNVDSEVKEEVCERLCIPATTNIGKYLGIPIKHRGAARNQLNFIAERVMNKLAGWKTRFLSFAGRAVLVKSVMAAIPNHVMQGRILPVHLCDKLDKINRDFLWGSTNEKRKLHLVGWSKIITDKENGGLGIQAARSRNIALLAKLNWRMNQEKDALWSKVILRKYCSADRRRSTEPDKLPASPNWAAIKLGFHTFAQGICWGVGNGARIKVWSDYWVKGESLRELVEGPLTRHETEMVVADMMCNGGQGWRWDAISFELPQSVKDKIRAIPCQQIGRAEDTILWKFSKNGDFYTKSAYDLANLTQVQNYGFQGQWIWKLDMLPKIVNFIWLIMHNNVPVRDVLASRGINCERLCPLCRDHIESISHLLRDCDYARNFWHKVRVPASLVNSFNSDFYDWLKINCQSKENHYSLSPWSYTFPFALWCLWKHRNRVVFENTTLNPNLHKQCISQALEYFFCVGKRKLQRSVVIMSVKWNKPLDGWFKLNTDGASIGNPGKAGGGGLIRDSSGNWVKGFSRSIGIGTSILAEFWALRDGLSLAVHLGIQNLEVELDARVVVDLISSNSHSNAAYTSLLVDCRLLLNRIPLARVNHVFREANHCADALAKNGCMLEEDFCIFDSAPPVVKDLLCKDVNGTNFCRLSAVNLASLAS